MTALEQVFHDQFLADSRLLVSNVSTSASAEYGTLKIRRNILRKHIGGATRWQVFPDVHRTMQNAVDQNLI